MSDAGANNYGTADTDEGGTNIDARTHGHAGALLPDQDYDPDYRHTHAHGDGHCIDCNSEGHAHPATDTDADAIAHAFCDRDDEHTLAECHTPIHGHTA